MAAVVAVKFGDVGYGGGCVEQHFLTPFEKPLHWWVFQIGVAAQRAVTHGS
jgi:hypothetical protein